MKKIMLLLVVLLTSLGINAKEKTIILEFENVYAKQDWLVWYLDKGGEELSGFLVKDWYGPVFELKKDPTRDPMGYECMDIEKWIGIPELSEHLGISKETIYRMLKSESIPAYKVGKLWRFKLSEIEAWMRKEK
jgi:excisionase family DNA binding protein